METKMQKPQARYDKAKTKMYGVKVVIPTEWDVYEKLERTPNKSGYIKALIRADMMRELHQEDSNCP